MDISPENVKSLQLLASESRISDELFAAILHNVADTVSLSTSSEKSEDICQSDMDRAASKEAYAGLVSFFLEAAKQDRDAATMRHILEDLQFGSIRTQKILDAYDRDKTRIRLLLSNSSGCFPHITDVKWRVDYCTKSNHLDKVNSPHFLVELETQKPGEDGTHMIDFHCSQEQLQDLVGKLKDACKSMERAAQT